MGEGPVSSYVVRHWKDRRYRINEKSSADERNILRWGKKDSLIPAYPLRAGSFSGSSSGRWFSGGSCVKNVCRVVIVGLRVGCVIGCLLNSGFNPGNETSGETGAVVVRRFPFPAEEWHPDNGRNNNFVLQYIASWSAWVWVWVFVCV